MILQDPPSSSDPTTVLTTLNITAVQQSTSSVAAQSIHRQVKLIILIPVSATIIITNTLMVLLLVFNRKLHRPSYFFLGCMCFADICVGSVSIWTMEWSGDRAFIPCLMRMSLLTSVVVASLFCMGCSAVDRYIAIITPLAYNSIVTKARAGFVMFMLWSAALCIGFAPLMGWDIEHSTIECSFCYIDTIEYEAFLFVTGFGFPMVTTIVIYILLFRNARLHIRRMEMVEHVATVTKVNTRPSTQLRYRCRIWKSRRMRSRRTLVLMISCFLVTWCPFVVTSVIQMICDDACDLKYIIGSYLLILGFCNSFFNPVIYAVSNKEMKTVVWSTFLRCRKGLLSTSWKR